MKFSEGIKFLNDNIKQTKL